MALTSKTTAAAQSLPIARLRQALSGRIIVPADPDYDSERTVFMGDIDKHPAVMVRVANADDVA